MDRFSQQEAASLAGFDERTFRTLVDKGVVLASPETRGYGRGKAKSFDIEEIALASVMRELDATLDPLQKVQVSSWLRRELPGIERQSSKANPYYVQIETFWNGGWDGDIRQARGDFVGGEEKADRKVSVMMRDGDLTRPAVRMIMVNVTFAMSPLFDEKLMSEVLAPMRAGNKVDEASD